MPEAKFDTKKLGLQISVQRSEKQMSQEELAEMCGVSRNTVASWESGQKEPKLSSAILLAMAFGCSVQDFLKGLLPEEVSSAEDEGARLCAEARSRLSNQEYLAFIKHMKATLEYTCGIKAS